LEDNGGFVIQFLEMRLEAAGKKERVDVFVDGEMFRS
jgi:hypothetical protein